MFRYENQAISSLIAIYFAKTLIKIFTPKNILFKFIIKYSNTTFYKHQSNFFHNLSIFSCKGKCNVIIYIFQANLPIS